jgi:hypothetical protein
MPQYRKNREMLIKIFISSAGCRKRLRSGRWRRRRRLPGSRSSSRAAAVTAAGAALPAHVISHIAMDFLSMDEESLKTAAATDMSTTGRFKQYCFHYCFVVPSGFSARALMRD